MVRPYTYCINLVLLTVAVPEYTKFSRLYRYPGILNFSVVRPPRKLPRPWPGLAWPPWPEAIMACDGLRVVLVASEWPQARPASGHARPGHGLRPARRLGAGASGGSGDNYYLKSRNIPVSWQTMPEVLKRQYLEVFPESYRFQCT